jgi:hypothetical protein
LLYALTRTFRKEAVMTDEQRIEESSDQLGADENEDVEAHKRRSHLVDEPAAENDDDDDVEAHRRRA